MTYSNKRGTEYTVNQHLCFFSISYLITIELKQKIIILSFVFWVWEIGLPYQEKNIGCGCFRMKCWWIYLSLSEKKYRETVKMCIIDTCVLCTVLQILFGWRNQLEWDKRVRYGENNVYKVLVEIPEGGTSLAIPRNRSEYNIRKDLK
jgi:hypothetical protein